jgi:excisionase family DNA binding protein
MQEFVVSETPQHNRSDRRLLSTAEASKISGLSKIYIQYLARTGRVEGAKPGGHDWLIYEDSLKAFLAQPRTKGRKGPRKKREVRQTEQGERVLLSTSEAHERYGYVKDTLLRLLRSGRIEGERSGRTWLIYEDSLLAYKQRKHPTKSEPPSAPTGQ